MKNNPVLLATVRKCLLLYPLLVACVFLFGGLTSAATQNSACFTLRTQCSAKHALWGYCHCGQDTFAPASAETDTRWYGICYGPYRPGQSPGGLQPTQEELTQDLKIIARYWQNIRLYGADSTAAAILHVIQVNNFPIKVMLGIWLENDSGSVTRHNANLLQINTGIRLANQFPSIITSVCVGNETQVYWSAHRFNQAELLSALRLVRAKVAQPITTADDYSWWMLPESREVASAVDFLTVHAHPLWNGVQLDSSVNWVGMVVQNLLTKVHSGRLMVIGETGWATDFNRAKTGQGEQGTLIKGKTGAAEQQQFSLGMQQWGVHNKIGTFLFEAFDEPWKGGGTASPATEVEKNWGLFYADRVPKWKLQIHAEEKLK